MPLPRTLRPRSLGAVGLSLTLLSAACSGGSSSDLSAPVTTVVKADVTTSTTAEAQAAPVETPADSTPSSVVDDTTTALASMIPSAPVTDVATGASVDFASIAPADTPILLWMWAPH